MPVPTLYHGTDARILRMSPDEVESFRKDITCALDYLWEFFKPYKDGSKDLKVLEGLLDYKDPELFSKISLAMNINQHRLDGRRDWQYNGLHVTNCEELAWHYARRAYHFGEIGMITYQFIRAAKIIRFHLWNPDARVSDTIKRIFEFAEGNREPVVVVLEGVDIKNLRSEGGKKLKEGTSSRVFLLKGKVDLRKFNILTEPSGNTNYDLLRFSEGVLVPSKW